MKVSFHKVGKLADTVEARCNKLYVGSARRSHSAWIFDAQHESVGVFVEGATSTLANAKKFIRLFVEAELRR